MWERRDPKISLSLWNALIIEAKYEIVDNGFLGLQDNNRSHTKYKVDFKDSDSD